MTGASAHMQLSTCIFAISCQNLNVAKRVANCRFGLTMLRISVWNCMLVPLLNRYQGCVAAFITVNFRSAYAGRSWAYLYTKIARRLQPFLFDKAEKIRRANITSSTKQLAGSVLTNDGRLGAETRKLKPGVAAPTSYQAKAIFARSNKN